MCRFFLSLLWKTVGHRGNENASKTVVKSNINVFNIMRTCAKIWLLKLHLGALNMLCAALSETNGVIISKYGFVFSQKSMWIPSTILHTQGRLIQLCNLTIKEKMCYNFPHLSKILFMFLADPLHTNC